MKFIILRKGDKLSPWKRTFLTLTFPRPIPDDLNFIIHLHMLSPRNIVTFMQQQTDL